MHLFERREDDTRMSCEFRFEVMHFPIRWGVSGQRERKGKKEKEGRGGEKRERERESRWAKADGRGEKKKRELLEQ